MRPKPIIDAPKADETKVAEVKHWRLEKRDAAGEIFEVIEGGDREATRVTFRRPGEPAESYTSLPYEGDDR